MPQPTIAAGYPAALLNYVASRGGSRAELLVRAQLREEWLADADNRVPLTQYLLLFQAGIEACSDPALALHFGETVPMRDISLMGLVAQHATSVEELCELHNRYGRLTIDDGDGSTSERMAMRDESGKVWLMFTSSLYVKYPVLTEAMFARCVSGIRSLYAAAQNGAHWPYPKAIHFTYERPPHYREYERFFNTTLVFNSDRNAWLMDSAFVAARRPAVDSYAAHAFRRHADALLQRLPVMPSVRGEVERIVASRLDSHVSIGQIAAALGFSRQTLLRRLKEEHVTFAQVLAELRQGLAVRYVTEGRLPLKQVASALGYTETTSFSRAFKRWTGHSPREYAAMMGQRSLARKAG